jgi:hypothetical protein
MSTHEEGASAEAWARGSASRLSDIGESQPSASSTSTVLAAPRSRPRRSQFERTTDELENRFRDVHIAAGEPFEPINRSATQEKIMDELTVRYKRATEIADRRIDQIFREIYASTMVDICFLMDCTGSMSPYIREVQTSINSIVKQCTTANGPAKSMRCAMVGYRDFWDGEKQFEVLDFTDNVDSFIAFCSGIIASGGRDEAEDVFGGIEKALALRWDDQRMSRIIFHVADSPCHGKQYHDGSNDYHAAGDPKGRKASELFSQMRDKSIQYYFGKITSTTDVMIAKFEEERGEPIEMFDIRDPKFLITSVVTSVTHSVSTAVMLSKAGVRGKEVRAFTKEKFEPNWSDIPVRDGTAITYKYPVSIEELLRLTRIMEHGAPRKVKIKIAPHPFSEGSERIAYYGRDLTHDTDGPDGARIILKEFKHKGKGLNSGSRYRSSCQIQTVASFFADLFAQEIKKKSIVLDMKLKYLKVKVVSVPLPGVPTMYRYMTQEKELVDSTNFIRFTNNVGYKITKTAMDKAGISQDQVDLVIAFSHWTNQVSNGGMTVVDLQGVFCPAKAHATKGLEKAKLLLTDPAIHTTNRSLFPGLNFGKRGMMEFFRDHECNPVCHKLGLTPGGIGTA